MQGAQVTGVAGDPKGLGSVHLVYSEVMIAVAHGQDGGLMRNFSDTLKDGQRRCREAVVIGNALAELEDA
ncbi:hypothetical protein StoSoilB22_40580 [Arthrobacter sp. StoSoilB22]|nr:hypothetical protein StoSoilB22_40580 [Arthrobacter sp. StoSoilB22]